jgi:hypothetical protein
MHFHRFLVAGALLCCSISFAADAPSTQPAPARAQSPARFRPPAAPLVTHDPYFSIWSTHDKLTDGWSTHWTGKPHALFAAVQVDGDWHRLIGAKAGTETDLPALEQTGLVVLPTRTIARFEGSGVRIDVTFMSPALPAELNVLARPLTYVTFEVRSTDPKAHAVNLYFDACAEIAVNTTDQVVSGSLDKIGDIDILRAGTTDQKVLGRKGDRVRIDWGHLYLAAPSATSTSIGDALAVRPASTSPGAQRSSQAVKDGFPVLSCRYALGEVGADVAVRHIMLAYDEVEAVEYLGQRLKPYWRREFADAKQLIAAAEKDYDRLTTACRAFDRNLLSDLTRAGGEKYAQLCALSYREALAGHGFALSTDDRLFMFAKENSSNGCIGTVDVIYPAAPIFLLLSPTMMEANLAPVIEYADSPRWKFPFAPHDLGTYPLANGQVYGGGEKTEKDQMPVEETANMLILVAALERAAGSPSKLASDHMPLLRKWADYLIDKGLDPENQLCTDDFTGHLAHNVNLSAKAIVGIAAYGQVLDNHKQRSDARRYTAKAKSMARQWTQMATEGDHTKLAFDKPNTWSQKYNLVWDKVLGLKVFPPQVAQREIAYYKTKQNRYGLPLDNRAKFTKLDWLVWSASLATNDADFQALISPAHAFANATPDRVPLTDWYQTDSAKNMHFTARPVVGGVFMTALCDRSLWNKWSRASHDIARSK